MRVEYINPFVDSAIAILKQTITGDIKRGDVYLRESMSSMLGIALIIGLAGQVRGRVIINMSKETGLKIASIMNQEKRTAFDELTSSTLTELANMIVGNAVTKLHELGFRFELTPPAMIIGEKLKISDRELESLIVPLESSHGLIEINVALKEEII